LRPSTLEAFSRTLGVSIDYLVDGSQSPPMMLDHSAFPYRTEDGFRTTMGSFLSEGVERSEAMLAVTTLPNIELLRDHLGNDARGFLTTPIAALEAFRAYTQAKLERGARWVRILGEPRWVGRSDADVRLWTRFESLFNLVFAASPMTVTCPYDERTVAPEILRQARLTHPHTLGERGVSQSPDYTEPGRFALETE
jgi:hypothetical protein